MPVLSLDGSKIGDGKMGPVCKFLQERLEKELESGESFEEFMKWGELINITTYYN